MTNNRALSTARLRFALLAVSALGLASAAPAALAQSTSDKPAAAAEQAATPPWPGAAPTPPNSVAGVTVSGQRPGAGGNAIPDDKAAAYNAEVAKAQAWKDYRKSTPRATNDPNDLSKDYPGLQTLLPPPK